GLKIGGQQQENDQYGNQQSCAEACQSLLHGRNLTSDHHPHTSRQRSRSLDGLVYLSGDAAKVFSKSVRRQRHHPLPVQPVIFTHYVSISHLSYIAKQRVRG